MKTSLLNAAKSLYSLVNIPSGTFNVVPLNDENGMHILVWVDKNYMQLLNNIPSVYDGYKVEIKEKPKAYAYN